MDPLVHVDYPEIVKKTAGNRIPSFTKNQSGLVKGSFDFIGVNYYDVISCKHIELKPEPSDYYGDMAVIMTYYNLSTVDPYRIIEYPALPWGLQGGLEYFKNVYGNPPIYIQENGQLLDHNVAVYDQPRIEYLQIIIGAVLDAIS